MATLFQLARPVQVEIDIKKSRFIACLYPVNDREQAMLQLVSLRRQWPDARHFCAVLLVDGDSMLDDDGEPSGTAAKPIYNVLMHKKLHNVFAVVVRYFGGVKLGAGGLVRAYTQAVSAALQQGELLPVQVMTRRCARVGFAQESRLRRFCAELGVAVEVLQYAEDVVLSLLIPQDQLAEMQSRLYDLMAGDVYFMTDEM